jgi:hypothetical protein
VVDLELEIARRNARLRAFRGLGVPVEGGWERSEYGLYYVTLRCLLCQGPAKTEQLQSSVALVMGRGLDRPNWIGAAREAELNAAFATCLGVRWKQHLDRLWEEDPPGLAALYELELLAGEGGHHG